MVELGTGPRSPARAARIDNAADEPTFLRENRDSVTTDAAGVVDFGPVAAGRSRIECSPATDTGTLLAATSVNLAAGTRTAVEIPAVRVGDTEGWIGVDLAMRRYDGQVDDVTPDGRAARAGIARGDAIVTVDGIATDGLEPMVVRSLIERHEPRSRVQLTVRRGPDRRTVDLVVGTPPQPPR